WLASGPGAVLRIAASAGIVGGRGQQVLDDCATVREQKSRQGMLCERDSGVQVTAGGEERRRWVRVNPDAGRFGEGAGWMILAGK
ncbi:hypothetical protein, partial [Staphylococcus pseudintermedius]